MDYAIQGRPAAQSDFEQALSLVVQNTWTRVWDGDGDSHVPFGLDMQKTAFHAVSKLVKSAVDELVTFVGLNDDSLSRPEDAARFIGRVRNLKRLHLIAKSGAKIVRLFVACEQLATSSVSSLRIRGCKDQLYAGIASLQVWCATPSPPSNLRFVQPLGLCCLRWPTAASSGGSTFPRLALTTKKRCLDSPC